MMSISAPICRYRKSTKFFRDIHKEYFNFSSRKTKRNGSFVFLIGKIVTSARKSKAENLSAT